MKTLNGKEYTPVASNIKDYRKDKIVFIVFNCAYPTREVNLIVIDKIEKSQNTTFCKYTIESFINKKPLEMSFALSDHNIGKRNDMNAYNKVFLTPKAAYNHIKRLQNFYNN